MSEANSGLHWTTCTSGGRIRSQCALERRERILACALRADKTSVSVPMVDGELVAGAWQQAVAINLNNRVRQAGAGDGNRLVGPVTSPASQCGFQYLKST